jgi:hypothetical protein
MMRPPEIPSSAGWEIHPAQNGGWFLGILSYIRLTVVAKHVFFVMYYAFIILLIYCSLYQKHLLTLVNIYLTVYHCKKKYPAVWNQKLYIGECLLHSLAFWCHSANILIYDF